MLNSSTNLKQICLPAVAMLLAIGSAAAHSQGCKDPTASRTQSTDQAATTAALVHQMLLEGNAVQAANALAAPLAHQPDSAPLRTAHAEILLRRGQPWLAEAELKQVIAADPCAARAHLLLSRILRLDSRYASQRAEIQAAYAIDPNDPEIRRAWNRIVSPANDVEAVQASLATTRDLDPEIRRKAEDSSRGLLTLLSENSQTCKGQPTLRSGSMPLLPSMRDGKQVDAYKLEVQFAHSKASLVVDTAGSGLYISQQLANLNGYQHQDGAPVGTVLADRVSIGPFEFHQCTVGVSDLPFAGNGDGTISTDTFAEYLVTLDFPRAKMEIAPLPIQPATLPGDRSQAPETASASPVYRSQNYLLVPVTLNKKETRLFLLDTGIRYTTMKLDVAHAASTMKMNFTNAAQTKSGAKLDIYRDSFDFAFGGIQRANQDHVLELDPESVSQSAGMDVAGMLGFDMLHSMTMQLDYRDGLVKFESPEDSPAPNRKATSKTLSAGLAAPPVEPCPPVDPTPAPITSTIVAKSKGFIDLAHSKAGQALSLQVMLGWKTPECELRPGDFIYGKITAADTRAAAGPKVAMSFDRGDCLGHGKAPLKLAMIAVLAPPGEFKALHNVMPTPIGGGRSRAISNVVADMGISNDQNLNEATLPGQIVTDTVLGLPALSLASTGGPACSALLTASETNTRLGTGTRFILLQR